MTKRTSIYYGILFLIFSLSVFAQRNNFQVYSIEQGLPQATIYCITQDHNGYLWLGTEGRGLCRFDGINF
ncbi:MAG TPA: two-component regulator propeller domain-containing protein, partial [Bacteroidia bacterium]|nr:two-component regulator propeller domain-containing protein [Bacteroidia bacterium]